MFEIEKEKQTEDGNELEKVIEKKDDGRESISEYIEKQKEQRLEDKEDKEKEKTEKKNEQDEEVKNVLSTTGQVISAVPHFASFALGGLAGGTLTKLIDAYDKWAKK